MYQSGTLWSLIICSCSSVSPFPFRTPSMILKDASCSSPWLIKYTMISSRQQIAVEITASPFSINVWAFPSHTSVPWDKPEIRTRSEKLCGCVSWSIWITKSVPNSGTPSDPSGVPSISSGVIPNVSVPWNNPITPLSSIGIVCASIPVISSILRIIDGSSCPRISSFNRFWSMEWYSKWVVMIGVFISFAGCCTAVKS